MRRIIKSALENETSTEKTEVTLNDEDVIKIQGPMAHVYGEALMKVYGNQDDDSRSQSLESFGDDGIDQTKLAAFAETIQHNLDDTVPVEGGRTITASIVAAQDVTTPEALDIAANAARVEETGNNLVFVVAEPDGLTTKMTAAVESYKSIVRALGCKVYDL